MTHYRESKYGFEYGAAIVERAASHKGYVSFMIRTERQLLQIDVTPTGFIRVGKPIKIHKDFAHVPTKD